MEMSATKARQPYVKHSLSPWSRICFGETGLNEGEDEDVYLAQAKEVNDVVTECPILPPLHISQPDFSMQSWADLAVSSKLSPHELTAGIEEAEEEASYQWRDLDQWNGVCDDIEGYISQPPPKSTPALSGTITLDVENAVTDIHPEHADAPHHTQEICVFMQQQHDTGVQVPEEFVACKYHPVLFPASEARRLKGGKRLKESNLRRAVGCTKLNCDDCGLESTPSKQYFSAAAGDKASSTMHNCDTGSESVNEECGSGCGSSGESGSAADTSLTSISTSTSTDKSETSNSLTAYTEEAFTTSTTENPHDAPDTRSVDEEQSHDEGLRDEVNIQTSDKVATSGTGLCSASLVEEEKDEHENEEEDIWLSIAQAESRPSNVKAETRDAETHKTPQQEEDPFLYLYHHPNSSPSSSSPTNAPTTNSSTSPPFCTTTSQPKLLKSSVAQSEDKSEDTTSSQCKCTNHPCQTYLSGNPSRHCPSCRLPGLQPEVREAMRRIEGWEADLGPQTEIMPAAVGSVYKSGRFSGDYGEKWKKDQLCDGPGVDVRVRVASVEGGVEVDVDVNVNVGVKSALNHLDSQHFKVPLNSRESGENYTFKYLEKDISFVRAYEEEMERRCERGVWWEGWLIVRELRALE